MGTFLCFVFPLFLNVKTVLNHTGRKPRLLTKTINRVSPAAPRHIHKEEQEYAAAAEAKRIGEANDDQPLPFAPVRVHHGTGGCGFPLTLFAFRRRYVMNPMCEKLPYQPPNEDTSPWVWRRRRYFNRLRFFKP